MWCKVHCSVEPGPVHHGNGWVNFVKEGLGEFIDCILRRKRLVQT